MYHFFQKVLFTLTNAFSCFEVNGLQLVQYKLVVQQKLLQCPEKKKKMETQNIVAMLNCQTSLLHLGTLDWDKP